jgi:hypothetical protein
MPLRFYSLLLFLFFRLFRLFRNLSVNEFIWDIENDR